MILTCGGIKGGTGKTTVAVHLAIMRAAEGGEVLLVDADDQATATDFGTCRYNKGLELGMGYTAVSLSGLRVRSEVLKLRSRYTDIIIDTGGRDTASQRSALSISDTLLLPFLPRSFDVWTAEKVARLVSEMRAANPGLEALAFLNRADSQGSDNNDARAALAWESTITILSETIGNRKAIATATAHGLAVTESKPRDEKAVAEMTAIYRRVFAER